MRVVIDVSQYYPREWVCYLGKVLDHSQYRYSWASSQKKHTLVPEKLKPFWTALGPDIATGNIVKVSVAPTVEYRKPYSFSYTAVHVEADHWTPELTARAERALAQLGDGEPIGRDKSGRLEILRGAIWVRPRPLHFEAKNAIELLRWLGADK